MGAGLRVDEDEVEVDAGAGFRVYFDVDAGAGFRVEDDEDEDVEGGLALALDAGRFAGTLSDVLEADDGSLSLLALLRLAFLEREGEELEERCSFTGFPFFPTVFHCGMGGGSMETVPTSMGVDGDEVAAVVDVGAGSRVEVVPADLTRLARPAGDGDAEDLAEARPSALEDLAEARPSRLGLSEDLTEVRPSDVEEVEGLTDLEPARPSGLG